MNKKLLTIATLGACLIATEGLAVKLWVENQTQKEIKAEFGSTTRKWSTKKPFTIPTQMAKSHDLVGGVSLNWFTINGQKVTNLGGKGAYWYLIVKPTEEGNDFIYELYRVKDAYAAKMAVSIIFSPITGYTSLAGLPKAKKNLGDAVKQGRIPVGS